LKEAPRAECQNLITSGRKINVYNRAASNNHRFEEAREENSKDLA
jgi:hypothetical protein